METIAEMPHEEALAYVQCPTCRKWTPTGGRAKFLCARCHRVVTLETHRIVTLQGGRTHAEAGDRN